MPASTKDMRESARREAAFALRDLLPALKGDAR
jgi:hypothetical protein